MAYTIIEVAKKLNLSPYTIRYYAREGLLDFVERDERGNRMFKGSDFEKLFIIASLKRAGMTIKQIKKFIELAHLGDDTIAQRLQIINDQREFVEEKITELQDALDILKYKSWLYETALKAGTSSIHRNMSLKDIPKNVLRIKERIRRLSDDMEHFYKKASE